MTVRVCVTSQQAFAKMPTYLGAAGSVDVHTRDGRLFASVDGADTEVVMANAKDLAALPYDLLEGMYVGACVLGLMRAWNGRRLTLPVCCFLPLPCVCVCVCVCVCCVLPATLLAPEVLVWHQHWQCVAGCLGRRCSRVP